MYEDGEEGGANAELSVYKEKRKAMENRVKAIFLRLVELEARPKSVEAARAVIASSKNVMLLWPTERPQITAEDTKEVEEVIESVSTWLDEKEAEQKDRETTETPAFTSKEVSNKMTRLKNLVARLLKKQRPAPKLVEDLLVKEETKEEGGDEKKGEDGEGSEEGEDASDKKSNANAEGEAGDAKSEEEASAEQGSSEEL